jgi:6-phosphogluconolactonase/glucosamine-6-phosphate isomerase/deaminase
MKIVISPDPAIGTQALADKLSSLLGAGKKVLWLIPGGSNIPISVEAVDIIRASVSDDSLKNLTITLTDERYGPVGHEDSNWKQLIDAGMDFDSLEKSGVRNIPVLHGLPLADTVSTFSQAVQKAFDSSEIVIGQCGMGADGHIAGILPGSPAVGEKAPACGYSSGTFTRITLTPLMLEKIDVVYAFVYGSSKKAAIERLRDSDIPIDEQPAQLLKAIPEAYVYTDQA